MKENVFSLVRDVILYFVRSVIIVCGTCTAIALGIVCGFFLMKGYWSYQMVYTILGILCIAVIGYRGISNGEQTRGSTVTI